MITARLIEVRQVRSQETYILNVSKDLRQTSDLYAHVLSHCPQHLPIMPSLLNKQTSLPLIAMCRSVPSIRLSNSMFSMQIHAAPSCHRTSTIH